MRRRHVIAIAVLLPVCACDSSVEERHSRTRGSARTGVIKGAEPRGSPSERPAQGPINTSPPADPRQAAAGQPGPSKPAVADVDAILKEADLALQNNNAVGALMKIQEALALKPDHRRALILQIALLQDQAHLAGEPAQVQLQQQLFLHAAAAARQLGASHADLDLQEKSLAADALYNEACVYARMSDRDKAMASLGEAIDTGFSKLKLLDTDPDLTTIRRMPAFRDLQKRANLLAKSGFRAWAKKLLAEQKPFEFTFRRPDVRSIRTISLSEFKGKIVVVDLWATWCPPCRLQVPELVKLHKAFRARGFQVVSLNFEGTNYREARAAVHDFIKQNGITYTCLLGDEKTKKQLPEFVGYPTLLFFDRTGRMRLMRVGYHPYELLEAVVTALLDEPGTIVVKKS